jgi:hypothetical protein
MATNALNFAAEVSAWVRQTEARMTAVFRESSQRLASLAQSRIPVDTGFARASIRASLQAMPQIDPNSRGVEGQSYGGNATGQVTATIASATAGEHIYIGWTASYVGFLENGHSKQAPTGFVRISAMEWPRIVREVCAQARGRAGT